MAYDVSRVLENLNLIYNSTTKLKILEDFESVLNAYDIYVYDNWADGELLEGPINEKYWVTCYFMWPANKKPDMSVLKRLHSANIKTKTGYSYILKPRDIKSPDDVREGTNKGKLDRHKICIVGIKIPLELIASVANSPTAYDKDPEEEQQSQAPNAGAAAPSDMPVMDAGMPAAPGVI